MKNWFNTKTGILQLDEDITNNPSYKKIMEDGEVSDKELQNQAQRTLELFQKTESILNDEQKEMVGSLLTELSVLQAVYTFKQIAELKEMGV